MTACTASGMTACTGSGMRAIAFSGRHGLRGKILAGTKQPQQVGTALAVQQFVEGFDFEPPARMISDLTAEQATIVPPGSPYSIATVVAHMLFWQKQWLGRILYLPMERKKGKNGDFPIVTPEQWPAVRDEFIAGFE